VVTICTTCFNILKLCSLPTECICVFRTVLTIHSDCSLKQHEPLGFCSGDVTCFLWGTNWIFIYYQEEIQSLKVYLLFILAYFRSLGEFINFMRSPSSMCVSVPPPQLFPLLNRITDSHETWYKHYAIGGHPVITYNFLQSLIIKLLHDGHAKLWGGSDITTIEFRILKWCMANSFEKYISFA
jgi:hypothetical protein